MKHFQLPLVAVTMLVVAACAGNDIPDPEPDYDAVDGGDAGLDAGTSGFDDDGMDAGEFFGISEEDSNDEMEQDLTSIIYFDFDQSELRAEYGDLLARHARLLADDTRMRVRLEGHADERGSREYNIGLGERRSQAVRRMLLIQGATAAQISTVSFGEERPASLGGDEESYSMNRRVEIVYTN